MEEQDFQRIKQIANEASQNISLTKVREVAEEASTSAVIRVHRSLGIDVDNHLEAQKDFAYVRKAREREEDRISRFYNFLFKGVLIAIVAAVSTKWEKIMYLIK